MSRIHRTLKRAAFLVITLSLSLVCFLFTASAAQPGRVTGDNVRLRSEPSTESAVLTTLQEGDTLEILDSSDSDWLQVSHTTTGGDILTGYISRFLAHIGPGGEAQVNQLGVPKTAAVNDAGAFLFNQPDTASGITAVLESGAEVQLLTGGTDGWELVRFTSEEGSCSGYISADRLTVNPIAVGSVNTEAAAVYAQPAEDGEAVYLETGTLVYILDLTDGWYQIRTEGAAGYLKAELVTTGYEDNVLRHGIVTGDSLRLRSSAGTGSKVLATLSTGVIFQITSDQVDGWYAIRYNGKTGYVSADFVELCDSSVGGYIQTTAPSLPLMSGAGNSFTVLAEIDQGTVLTIEGNFGKWYLVSYEGEKGFINSSYVSATTERGYYNGSNGAGLGAEVAAFACQFAGNPYRWGGTSLTNGADCSGFVLKVYENFGVSLPHSSSAMRGCGRGVSYDEMQPGDIVCYSGHVGIYAGNGQIINALGEAYGITYTNVNYKSIIAIRRIFD